MSDDSGIEAIEAPALAELLATHNVVLVDVREPAEYLNERIAGALLFPLSSFDPLALPADGGRLLVFHCGSGMRSAKAARRRLEAGAPRATHLTGGIAAWKAAGLPVITAPRDPTTWAI